NVNAVGTVQREPERAVITVAVESNAQNAQQAAQANATKMDAVFAALRRVGIVPPKVRTIAYELQPQYAQPDRENPNPTLRVIGYRAINMVVVEVDSIKRVGAVIDATTAAGANRVANLSFELRDPESARLEALRIAVARARQEAEVLASASGQKLGPPVNISSSSYYEPRRYRMDAAEVAMAAPAPPPTPIEAGTLTITANVNIVYRMVD
ncbi:MAG TPA: SIMPL domain-containing protein, partial [Longimicrobiales bacterium]